MGNNLLWRSEAARVEQPSAEQQSNSRTSGNPIGDRLFNFGGQTLTTVFF
jgi:hypothetical protein